MACTVWPAKIKIFIIWLFTEKSSLTRALGYTSRGRISVFKIMHICVYIYRCIHIIHAFIYVIYMCAYVSCIYTHIP